METLYTAAVLLCLSRPDSSNNAQKGTLAYQLKLGGVCHHKDLHEQAMSLVDFVAVLLF